MKNSKKRGFTIVELVIVIAVIAILAGVLIPTFVSVIKKGQEANDTALIKYLNTSLTAGTIGGKTPDTMQDALDIVEADGYNVAKIKATASGARILWDSKNNCFVYLKDGENEPTYIPDSKNVPANNVDYWQITEADEELSATYSNYLALGYTKDLTDVQTGLDVGQNTGITAITYKGTGSAQEVVLRTNSFDTIITVNAETDVVRHHGDVKEVNVAKVAPSSYHEYGTVSGNINLAYGKVELMNGSSVSNVVVKEIESVTPTTENVKVSVESGAKATLVISEVASVSVTVEGAGEATVGKVNADDTNVAYVGKVGYSDFESAINASSNGDTIVLLKDVSLTGACTIAKSITLDLNNNTISINNAGIRVNENNNAAQVNVALKNGTITRTNSSSSTCVVYIFSGANVTCDNLTINHDNSDSEYYSIGIMDNNAELTINSGVYNGMVGTLGSKNGNIVTINGGEFNMGCYFPARGNYTINGGTFTSVNKSSFYIKSGTPLKINGGTFNVTLDSNYKNQWAHYDNGAVGGNAVFVFEACSYGNSGVNPSATISSNVKINIKKNGYTGSFYEILVINYGYMDSNKKLTQVAEGNTANIVNTEGIKIPYRVANGQITGHVISGNVVSEPSDGWYVFDDTNTTLINPQK